MIGDVLKKRIKELSQAIDGSGIKQGRKLWQILKDIAIEEIMFLSPDRVSSSDIIPIYYSIIRENQNILSPYNREILPSNGQERFRVVVRNLFVTNAFHQDGLANYRSIKANRVVNSDRRGCRIVYQYVGGTTKW